MFFWYSQDFFMMFLDVLIIFDPIVFSNGNIVFDDPKDFDDL